MRLIDRLALPLLIFLDSKQAARLGLTPLDDERILAALPHCRGRLLDVGCGANRLVRRYAGQGWGVDVHPWPGIDQLISDSGDLPFAAGSFDTVAMLATLNHIVNRGAALAEAYRVLSPGGRLLVTMINPVVGWVAHRVRRRVDPDQLERGMGPGEVPGIWAWQVRRLAEAAGFRVVKTVPFVLGLNTLYVLERPAGGGTAP